MNTHIAQSPFKTPFFRTAIMSCCLLVRGRVARTASAPNARTRDTTARGMAARVALAFCAALLWATASVAAADPLPPGSSFPDIDLQGTFSPQQKKTLGLSGDGPFRLSDVQADNVLIEVFSMYCPHCQREAPEMNRLAALIRDSKPAGRLALLGLGVGNTQLEVDMFREQFAVPFALAIDPDLTTHLAVGEPGTPHFFLVSLRDRKNPVVLLSRTGRMQSAPAFLNEIRKLCGIE